MKARFIYFDGSERTVDVQCKTENGITKAFLPKEAADESVQYIDFLYDYFTANVGDEGYFVTNQAADGTFITRFMEREDCAFSKDHSFIACYGINKGKGGTLAIVTGMRYDFGMEIMLKNGIYSLYPRFYIDGDEMYEDICVEFYELKDGSYSAMARKYREFQLTRGGCVP